MIIKCAKKMRKSIIHADKLLKNGIPIELDEDTVESTNCYAYSLGIMYNGIRCLHYSPGYTEGVKYQGTGREELMKKTEIDFRNLKISFRRVLLDQDVQLKENEYLIKLFFYPRTNDLPSGDFHFIRQDPKTKKWFHKLGWYNQPTLVNQNNGIGTEPNRLIVSGGSCSYIIYQPVCYYIITET